MVVEQVVILVGGKGTRLGELTREAPKPLLPIVDDKRFLDYLLENTARQGFKDIILVAGHLGEQVAARYGDSFRVHGATVRVVVEPTARGTAGALVEVRHLLDTEFLMMNGDAFVDVNLRAFERAAAKLDCPAVIASLSVHDASRYGTLKTENSAVIAFKEKDPTGSGLASINAGVYRLNRSIVDLIGSLPASIESDIFPISGWFLDIGLPETLAIARAEMPLRLRRPCVFFDRDNTLIIDKGYTHRPEDLCWMDGAVDLIRKLNDVGILVIVCTNQAGVARGFYDETAVKSFHATMQISLAIKGAFIDAFYYCPYHIDGIIEKYRRDHADRKPNPGMLLRALADFSIDVEKALMIGDNESDIIAATAACVSGYLFRGGNLQEFALKSTKLSGMISD
jgi:D,D-heptose 1,7-bisphosphate phosphatase